MANNNWQHLINEFVDICNEYDTTNLVVQDLKLTYQGALITNVLYYVARYQTLGGEPVYGVKFWSGDPEADSQKHAAEIMIPEDVAMNLYLTLIVNYFS